MSWTDKELRRREAMQVRDLTARAGSTSNPDDHNESTSMTALWDKFEAANNALPEQLRLRHDGDRRESASRNSPTFQVWLIAPNRSGLGFTGKGIRYIWPNENPRKHPNFWIWFDADRGYRLTRTNEWSWSGAKTTERRFNETAVEHMIKCLVTGVRVGYKSVSRGRFWKFF